MKKDYARLRKNLRAALDNVQKAQNMGAFVLGFCAINWMATFYFGKETTGEEYIEFVERFMRGYNGLEMYKHLRNGLVHNYTDRGMKYDFQQKRSHHHLKERPLKHDNRRTKIVINLEDFRNDLKNALHELFLVLESNPELMKRAMKRYKNAGIIDGEVETL